jgi:hypothetical protein
VSRAVSALDEPRLAGPASAAVRRLGAAAVPALTAALAVGHKPRRPALVRAATAAAAAQGVEAALPALEDDDRTVVLTALEALDAERGRALAPPAVLDAVLRDAAWLAARASAARLALAETDASLARALDDEVDLARRLVVATLVARYGDPVREAVRVVERADGQRRALGVEALDVVLTREESTVCLPLVRRDALTMPAESAERSREEWIAELAADPERFWRSDWLATCARHAALRMNGGQRDRSE